MTGPGEEGPWPGETYPDAVQPSAPEDILAELSWLANAVKASGGGEYREYQVVMKAIGEIHRLRASSTITDPGHESAVCGYPEPQSFRDIKQEIKNGV